MKIHMTRLRWFIAGLILASPLLAYAAWTNLTPMACLMQAASPTYVEGTANPCTGDLAGNIRVLMGAPSGVSGTATADPPTLTEGSTGYFSWDLAGNLRMTLGTLLSGEDQDNNLLMTGAGVTRITTFSSVTAAATSSSITTVPSGPKKFVAAIAAGASESTAFSLTVFGNWTNSTTGAFEVCRIWINAVTTTAIQQDRCTTVDSPYTYFFYTTDAGATGYTSTSGKAITVYAMY